MRPRLTTARTAASDGGADQRPGAAAPIGLVSRTAVASAFIRSAPRYQRAGARSGASAAVGAPHEQRGCGDWPDRAGEQQPEVLVTAVERLGEPHDGERPERGQCQQRTSAPRRRGPSTANGSASSPARQSTNSSAWAQVASIASTPSATANGST